MVDRVGVDTRRVLRGADLFKNLCEHSGINVPSLQQILGVLVATKLCPKTWSSIVSRAYPTNASGFVFQIENYPDKALASKLTETPADALHILGMANFSTEAAVSGQYQRFCNEIGMPQNPTTQLMFFTLGCLDEQKHTIWGSEYMSRISNMTPEIIRRTLLPKVEAFAKTIEPRILQENYALLLSGMTFDLSRLEKPLLDASAFPCQQPAVPRESKQRIWSRLYHTVNALKQLRVNVNPEKVDPGDIKLAEEVATFVDTVDYETQQKQTLREHAEIAENLKSQFIDNQLTENELCKRSVKEVERLGLSIAVARQKADQNKMKIAGTEQNLKWLTPPTKGMDSELLHNLVGRMKSTLAILELFQKPGK